MKSRKKLACFFVAFGLMSLTSLNAASYTGYGQTTIKTSFGSGTVYHSATYVNDSNFNPKFRSAKSYTANTSATGSVEKIYTGNKKVCRLNAKIRIWYPSGSNMAGNYEAMYEYSNGKVTQSF